MKPNECHSELDWSAFCCAAGELDAATAEEFESRLAADQSAREALSRAVELTQIVAAAESQADYPVAPARRAAAEWGTRLSWMAIGGLASVVIALVWSGTMGNRSSAPSDQQYALAAAWTQTRAEIAEAKEDGLWLPSVSSWNDVDDDLLAMNDGSDESSPNETPSWMTAALFGLAGEVTSSEPFTNERGEN